MCQAGPFTGKLGALAQGKREKRQQVACTAQRCRLAMTCHDFTGLQLGLTMIYSWFTAGVQIESPPTLAVLVSMSPPIVKTHHGVPPAQIIAWDGRNGNGRSAAQYQQA